MPYQSGNFKRKSSSNESWIDNAQLIKNNLISTKKLNKTTETLDFEIGKILEKELP